MGNTNYKQDNDGFLSNYESWDKAFAERTAMIEKITLTENHWEIIYFLRDYYRLHHNSPSIRHLVNALKNKFGPDKGNSLYLQILFPESPARQATKIAGLPKPKRCI